MKQLTEAIASLTIGHIGTSGLPYYLNSLKNVHSSFAEG